MKNLKYLLLILLMSSSCSMSPFDKAEEARQKKDYTEAFKWYKKAAESGNTVAMVKLGAYYQFGQGTLEDDEEAFKWYKKAAELGDAVGMAVLGLAYYDGIGTLKDDKEAFKWSKKAADELQKAGAVSIAKTYGKLDPKNLSLIKEYGKDLDQFTAMNSLAMYSVATAYCYGEGTIKDPQEAFKWYKKAAELGNASAMYSVGAMYYNGYGILRDPQQAKYWMKKAYEAGNDQALREWNRLELWQY